MRQARKAGLSWTEIATALGVTRQSAWERWRELDKTLERD
ncbi:helix-turn-helix domain-containing protein [Arthrobacter sp. R1-13]